MFQLCELLCTKMCGYEQGKPDLHQVVGNTEKQKRLGNADEELAEGFNAESTVSGNLSGWKILASAFPED